jgi:hypothetical protein
VHLENVMSSLKSALQMGLLAVGITSAAMLAPGCSAPAVTPGANSPASAALHDAMRKLWEDHVTWTRLVIVSTAANLPDLPATTERLLKNQADIGDAIKPYYGNEAGEKLTTLLREHIVGAANVLAVAKTKDSASLETAKTAWYANGDSIATFLSTANPGAWPQADMQRMMREHLDLTLAEAVAQLEGRYPESVAGYDKVHAAILVMSDMLSAGIVKQYPKQF